MSIYDVGDDVPAVDVQWRGHDGWGDALYAGLLGLDPKGKGYPWPVPTLDLLPPSTGTLRGVPIPNGARPANGTDGALLVHRRSTGQLWELWQARQDSAGRWSAAWGGYVPDLPGSDGRYSGGLGVSASGLIVGSSAVTIAEARAGLVEHAVGIAVPHVVGARWSYPASRCDALATTSTAPLALFEGQRFRLRADVDVEALRVHPLCRAIARAAQRYGLVVVDHAGGVVVVNAEEGRAVMHAQLLAGLPQVNPWGSILGSAKTWTVLAGFPWDALEALPHDYGRPV